MDRTTLFVSFVTYVLFLLGFCVLHVASPYVVGAIDRKHRDTYDRLSDWTKRTYWRRMIRGEIYYVYAGCAGIVLSIVSYRSVEQMIRKYDDAIRIHACMSLAHWTLCMVEDIVCWKWLAADERHPLFVGGLATVYGVHHVITIFAYTFIVVTGDLSALGVFGLVFEVPVALQNLREYVVCFALPSSYSSTRAQTNEMSTQSLSPTKRRRPSIEADSFWRSTGGPFWIVLLLSIVVFRLTPCAVYVWSVFFWRNELKTLSLASQIVYYLLGTIFTVANPVYGLLMLFYFQRDRMQHARKTREKEEENESVTSISPTTKADVEDEASSRCRVLSDRRETGEVSLAVSDHCS